MPTFRITKAAIDRLGLSAAVEQMVFDAPPEKNGVLMGFTIGEVRWLRNHLKVNSTADFDQYEAMVGRYFLSVRRADHTILPITRFDDLTYLDFEDVDEQDQDQDPKALTD